MKRLERTVLVSRCETWRLSFTQITAFLRQQELRSCNICLYSSRTSLEEWVNTVRMIFHPCFSLGIKSVEAYDRQIVGGGGVKDVPGLYETLGPMFVVWARPRRGFTGGAPPDPARCHPGVTMGHHHPRQSLNLPGIITSCGDRYNIPSGRLWGAGGKYYQPPVPLL